MEHNKIIEDELLNILNNAGKKWPIVLRNLNPTWIVRKHYPLIKDVLQYIIDKTPLLNQGDFDYNIHTKIHWILNNLDDFPLCKVCKKPIKNWNIPNYKDNYKSTCCKECSRKQAQENNLKTLKEKYGVENSFQIIEVKKKLASSLEERIEKGKLTRLERYGDPNYNNSKQACQKKIELYGDVWNSKKCTETLIRLRAEGKLDNISKAIVTKRNNGTLNSSKEEEDVYILLKAKKYPDLIRHYKSEEYPYVADYYSPSNNLYIEYMASWTHGKHLFDVNSIDDQATLEKWKSKNTKYYNNAIDTWTRRDVEKHQRVIDKKLNMLYLWNLADVNKFLSL